MGTTLFSTITDCSVILEGPYKRWHLQSFCKGKDNCNDNDWCRTSVKCEDMYIYNAHRISTEQCNSPRLLQMSRLEENGGYYSPQLELTSNQDRGKQECDRNAMVVGSLQYIMCKKGSGRIAVTVKKGKGMSSSWGLSHSMIWCCQCDKGICAKQWIMWLSSCWRFWHGMMISFHFRILSWQDNSHITMINIFVIRACSKHND